MQSVIAIWLLAIYGLGGVGIDIIHHAVHDHEAAVVHNPEQEADSCHRAQFHHDSEHGCHHKSHLTASAKCKYSHVVFQSTHLLTAQATVFEFKAHRADFCLEPLFPSTRNISGAYLRGPPAA
jgi:hypothetical protein